MSPKKMNRLLWAVLLLLIGSALTGLYFADQRLSHIARNTSRLRAESELNQKKLAIYETSKQKVQSLEYVNDLAEQILPDTHNQSATVAEISQFALRSNLRVADITFDIPMQDTETPKKTKEEKAKEKSLPKGVKVVPFTLVLQQGARYDNVLDFLKTLENNRRKMQVINTSLTPSEEDGSILDQVSFRINLYTRQADSKPQEADNEN